MTSEELVELIAESIEYRLSVSASGLVMCDQEHATSLRDVLARLEAAEADTRRLDALEREHWENVAPVGSRDKWSAWTKDNDWLDNIPTLRDAIDAAMGETPDKT